jgi:uncharacterized protein
VRIVVDTNVFVSAIISQGVPRELLELIRIGAVDFYTSEILLAELRDVLQRDKFAKKLSMVGLTANVLVDDLRSIATLVTPLTTPPIVLTDPDDDHVLAAASVGAVDLIVSGDKRHLLPLANYNGIAIVTAR